MPSCAAFVDSDWSDLIAFTEPPPDPGAWIDDWFRGDHGELIARSAQQAFIGVDSAFWQYFSHSGTAVDRIVAHLERFDGFNLVRGQHGDRRLSL